MISSNIADSFRISSRVQLSSAVEVWLDDFELIDIGSQLRNVVNTPSSTFAVWTLGGFLYSSIPFMSASETFVFYHRLS